MDNNFKDDYSLLTNNQDVFNSKIKKQKKITLIVILLLCCLIAVYLIYPNSTNSLFQNYNTITFTSKDWTQKISLKKTDTRYSGPNSCPKWYHIPTTYEWRNALKLWCENYSNCDISDIHTEHYPVGMTLGYDGYQEFDDFINDFNIHLNRDFDLGIWFHKDKKLWVKSDYNSYCEALSFLRTKRGGVVDIYYYNLVPEWCDKPKYVRCFSDENLTTEFTNDEKFSSLYSPEYTEFEIDGITYSWWKITKIESNDVVIPDNYWWIPIIEIWGGLYSNIDSIKLWENIIKIDNDAFSSNRWWLKEIKIPNSVLYIWDYAFLNNKLTTVKFSDNLLYIWESAFGNNQLTSVELPNTVKFIGTWAFYQNEISSFHFPNWIKEIAPGLLRNNNLKSIEIPDWVEVIWDSAFYANELTEISLPQSLKTIWKQAFSCNNLTEVSLPKTVDTIWKIAFCWNKKGKDQDFKGYCWENGYVVVKWYTKNNDACINENPFKSCNNEKENWVCWKKWIRYSNSCHMEAFWDKEGSNYEFKNWTCLLKKN